MNSGPPHVGESSPAIGPPRPVSIVRNPQFVRLWAIGGLTSTMMWLDMLVIALLTLDLTDSPFLVSLTFFLRFTPMLFGFGIGVIADRMNRKHLMVFGLVVQIGVSAVLAILVIVDAIEFWHLAVGAFVTGSVLASEFPVRRTMIGEVVDPDRVGRAISLESGTSDAESWTVYTARTILEYSNYAPEACVWTWTTLKENLSITACFKGVRTLLYATFKDWLPYQYR